MAIAQGAPHVIANSCAQGECANGGAVPGKWVLGVEGEACVEACRSKMLAAITWQGGSWTVDSIAKDLEKL